MCLKLPKTNTKPKYCVPNVNHCMNVFVKKIKILQKKFGIRYIHMLTSIIYFLYLYDLNIAGFDDNLSQFILS